MPGSETTTSDDSVLLASEVMRSFVWGGTGWGTAAIAPEMRSDRIDVSRERETGRAGGQTTDVDRVGVCCPVCRASGTIYEHLTRKI